MKYLLILCLSLLSVKNIFSQEKHFIFIQSDNKQLFNVTINGKLYSSNASGYVIIPKLTNGEYVLTVGFPQNTFPEQQFKCIINNKDLGFGLKDFGDKGFGLFNLQTLDVSMNESRGEQPAMVKEIPKKKDEPISFNTLEQEIKPASEKPKPVIPPDIKESEPTTQLQQEIIMSDTIPSPEPKTTTSIPQNSAIVKVSENKNDSAVTLLFTDKMDGVTDTIQLNIPVNEVAPSSVVNIDTAVKVIEDSAVKAKIDMLNQRNDDIKVIEIESSDKKNETPDTAVFVAPVISHNSDNPPVNVTNSLCSNTADEVEYLKLRRKMSLESSDDAMIKEAKKAFKNKCFTTHHIRGLSSLFLSDDGRLKFLVAAYSFVSDNVNFATLETLFIDPAYIPRFKSIIQ